MTPIQIVPGLYHWSMDDNASSTTVVDGGGSNIDGTAQRNTVDLSISGAIDGALSFDGSSDYINVGDQPVLDVGTGDFSMSAWIQTSGSAYTQFVMAKRSNGYGNGYSLAVRSDGTVMANVLDADSYVGVTSTATVNDSQWHHLAAVADRDSNLTIYVDGVVQDWGSLSGETGDLSNSNPFCIGAKKPGVSLFNGAIDDVRVYNRVLSPEEIEALFDQVGP